MQLWRPVTLLALLPLLVAATPTAESGSKRALDDATLSAVAGAYYATLPDSSASAPAAAEPAGGLHGRVVDRRGRPVVDARVALELGGGAPVEVATDADGRFVPAMAPPPDAAGDLSVTVTAPGYERWAVATSRPPGGALTVRLDRALDDRFWAELAGADDPAERLWLLLEFVGARQMGAPEVTDVFPHVGGLRGDLVAFARSEPFAKPDDRSFTPRGRALELLAGWGDPADRALVAPWLETARGVEAGPKKAVGPTLDAVCARWADVHFARELKGQKVKTRTWHACDAPVVAPDGRHAVAVFRVRYAHWGYSHLLFFRKDGEKGDAAWRLHLVRDHMTEHYD